MRPDSEERFRFSSSINEIPKGRMKYEYIKQSE